MYKCIVVDDDKMSRISIKNLVTHHPELQLDRQFEDAQTALNYIENNKVDLIFLDVLMPDLNGFEMIKKLEKEISIIFISEYREFALDAFSFDVVDYLKKPIILARFNEAIDRFKKSKAKPQEPVYEKPGNQIKNEYLFVKVDGMFKKVGVNDIVYVENDGNYVNICTTQETLSPYGTVKDIEKKLPTENFIKPHRKYLVAMRHINGIDENFLLTTKKLIPISRDRKKDVYNALGL